jgi:hypothetical protein
MAPFMKFMDKDDASGEETLHLINAAHVVCAMYDPTNEHLQITTIGSVKTNYNLHVNQAKTAIEVLKAL